MRQRRPARAATTPAATVAMTSAATPITMLQVSALSVMPEG